MAGLYALGGPVMARGPPTAPARVTEAPPDHQRVVDAVGQRGGVEAVAGVAVEDRRRPEAVDGSAAQLDAIGAVQVAHVGDGRRVGAAERDGRLASEPAGASTA